MGCTGLKSVIIGENVETIGGGAFSGCTGIVGEIVVPEGVKVIGQSAFNNCSLSAISLPACGVFTVISL